MQDSRGGIGKGSIGSLEAPLALSRRFLVKKTLRNLILSSSVLIAGASGLHAAVTGGAPTPRTGRLAVAISAALTVLGY
jgi:hypothetical protein